MKLENGNTVLLGWPLAAHCITAGWLYNDGNAHSALDFRAAVGTPVYAAEDGVVASAYIWNGRVTKGDTNSYGNMVKLRHTNYGGKRLETLYAHLSKLCVKAGQSVAEGDLIGYSGETGNCYGAHLHFEVRLDGVRYNPLNWLDADFTTASAAVKLGEFKSVARPAGTVDTGNGKLQRCTCGPMSDGDAMRFMELARQLGVAYKAEYVEG